MRNYYPAPSFLIIRGIFTCFVDFKHKMFQLHLFKAELVYKLGYI